MEAVLRSADVLRRALWAASARTWLGRACVRSRGARMTTVALTHMVVVLAAVVFAPMWLLLIGPLVLGVPHVVADVRYLVLHPATRMGRKLVLALVLALGTMTVLRFGTVLGGDLFLRAEMVAAVVGLLAAAWLTPTTTRARIVASAVVLGLGVPAIAHPYPSALLFAHAHNFVALGLWMWWCRGGVALRHVAAVAGAFALASALILSGAFEPITAAMGGFTADAAGLTFDKMAATLAPGLDGAIATRLVLLYAFAQAIHYTLWLRLIPNAPPFLPRETPPTLRKSARSFARDFGWLGAWLAVALTLAVIVGAFAAPARTRDLYLSVAIFHGWLELAAIVHLALRGREAIPTTPR